MENLFISLSNKQLKDCYHSWIRIQTKREQVEEEVFSNYVDEYIWMLERNTTKCKFYDDNKKYSIGFSIAEKNMLHAMARRYLELYDVVNKIKPFFEECMDEPD